MSSTHITDYLYENAKKNPSKLALVSDDKSFTWAELCIEIETRSNYLRSLLPGSHQKVISLLIPNTWQFVVAYLAIIDSGHIAVPIDVIYKPLEIEAIIRQISPDLLIYDSDNSERVANKDNSLAFDDLKQELVVNEKLRLAPDAQIASLVFTSGTTGKPKIAPYSHSNHLWNIKACSEVWGWNNSDTMLLSLRLSHWYGICMGLSGALYHSNTIYLRKTFSAVETLEMLSSGKATLFSHTPFAFSKMLEEEGKYDLSRVHLLISGSAALPPTVWEGFKDKFKVEIIETYGSSETGRIAANSYQLRQPGSPGYLLKDVKAKLIDGNELAVQSPGLFPGYYNNQEATDANLTEDGFWKTGDLVEISDRRVVLKGRKQERLAKLGYTISPRDIEWALGQNKKIKECAVIGEPTIGDDDKLIYFVVGDITEPELIAYTKTDLPSIWRPDKIIFLSELPRTANGKIALQELKRRLE
jgi:acyl-CoA synthetase (AMP-forming)/AMP-acid ligase II